MKTELPGVGDVVSSIVVETIRTYCILVVVVFLRVSKKMHARVIIRENTERETKTVESVEAVEVAKL